MAKDIQALAEELAKLNKNNSLWAQPHIQQSGAASMMASNQAHIQPYAQNPVQLQAYANATPGVHGPAMGGNPGAANYALQQQHYLNPYQSQFYGGEYNSMLPGAQYQTSARMGIYRNTQGSTGPNFYGEGGVAGDAMTLAGYRGFAGYENPYEGTIAAQRRMFRRKEILATGALEVGSAVGGMFATSALGATLAVAAPLALGYGVSQYYGRRQETGQIYDTMKDLVSGESSTGFGGRGVNMRTASEMMRSMRSMSASDPHKTMEDYMGTLEMGGASGLFNYEDTGGEIMGKAKKALGMVNVIMQLAGDPDLQSTIQRMSNFQAMGVGINQMEGMATSIKGFAKLAGTTYDDVMQGGVALGAQQAQQMGGSAAFGMRIGGMAQGMANRMLQTGYLTPEEAALRGGKSGIMQTASGMMTNDIHSYLSTRSAGIMGNDGGLDQERYEKLLRGEGNSILNAVDGFKRVGDSTYLGNTDDVTAKAESQLTPVGSILFHKRIMQERANAGGLSLEQLYGNMGASGKAMRYMHSDGNIRDQLATQEGARVETVSRRFTEDRLANRSLYKAGRAISEFNTTLWNDIVDYDSIAEQDDIDAAEENGNAYNPGSLAMVAPKSFMEKMAKTSMMTEKRGRVLDLRTNRALYHTIERGHGAVGQWFRHDKKTQEDMELNETSILRTLDNYANASDTYDMDKVYGNKKEMERLRKLAASLVNGDEVDLDVARGVSTVDFSKIKTAMHANTEGFMGASANAMHRLNQITDSATVAGATAHIQKYKAGYDSLLEVGGEDFMKNLMTLDGEGMDLGTIFSDINVSGEGHKKGTINLVDSLRNNKKAYAYMQTEKGRKDYRDAAKFTYGAQNAGTIAAQHAMEISPYASSAEVTAAQEDARLRAGLKPENKEDAAARRGKNKADMIERGAQSGSNTLLSSINQGIGDVVFLLRDGKSNKPSNNSWGRS